MLTNDTKRAAHNRRTRGTRTPNMQFVQRAITPLAKGPKQDDRRVHTLTLEIKQAPIAEDSAA
jgi:hypothetical protein